MILIDKNHARNRQFLFFFMEPTDATVYNKDLFDMILLDKRYLSFNNSNSNSNNLY